MEDKDKITYFAETDSRNKRVKFGIRAEDRLRHVYSIGKTGMGKSTLLENMAIQDIQNGEGMAFLDPHGKTADLLLDYIPEHRIKDVIYFAPFDTEFPISFNVMEDVGPDRRHLVVAGLMSAFEKIWADQWSSRMAYILQNTLAALLEYPGATMLGINRMLTDKVFRNKVVDNVKDPTTRSFWVDEFAKYTERFAAEATPAIQNKVGQFVSNPLIRNIIGQPKSTFDIRKAMDEKKILIVNLSKGLVGEGNANLLGSMLVTKIYLAAMSRADASPQELKNLPNFYLYVDEFQSFANKSFADILSEARKYKLSLNITHQYIEQMAEEVRAAVFGNVGTMIAFRVGSFDAEILEKEFAPVFTMEDLVNLGFAQIYLKLMIGNVASQPFSATTLPPIAKAEISYRDRVMEESRKNYANKKSDVEKQISDWHAGDQKSEYKKPDLKPPVQSPARPVAPPPPPRPQPAPAPVPKQVENPLAKALEQAMKEKSDFASPSGRAMPDKEKESRSTRQTESAVPLDALRKDDKKNQKQPTEQNVNALKEAIQKAASIKQPVARQEEKLQSTNYNLKTNQKEVPEDVLKKVLNGG
jgi:hypothetical protein